MGCDKMVVIDEYYEDYEKKVKVTITINELLSRLHQNLYLTGNLDAEPKIECLEIELKEHLLTLWEEKNEDKIH